MKVAIITSGLLPIPASKGGAIETLVDSFIKENENQKELQLTVYSLFEKTAKKISKKNNYHFCKYVYINPVPGLAIKVINKIFKKNIPFNKYYQKRVVNLVNNKKYDYVIIENYPELALKLSNNKVIAYIHSDVFNYETPKAKNILDSCYKVITVSDYIKNRVLEINEKNSGKVVTVYNSIDFEPLDTNTKKVYRNDIIEKYNINKNDFVYAFSGRLSKEKGALDLIKAFNKITVPNKKLLIIGGAWYGSKKQNNYVELMHSLSNKDIIYTGYVSHKDIQKLLCAVNVGVVPSNCNEAAGLSVVEFMNVGATVVASNKGGIKEYLNCEDNILTDYESEEQFINSLSKALEESYNIYSEKKCRNNIKFSKRFTVKKNYDEIIKVLK